MANNNILFNAAYNAVGGAILQRWLVSATAADYLRYRSAMTAFATAVDGTQAPGSYSQQHADLLQSICLGVLGNRDIRSFVSADYDTIAASIAAMYNELQSSLEPVDSGGAGQGLYKETGSTELTPAVDTAIITLDPMTVAEGDTFQLTWAGLMTITLDAAETLDLGIEVLQPGEVTWEGAKGTGVSKVGTIAETQLYVTINALGIAASAGEIQFRLAYTLAAADNSQIDSISTLAAVQVGDATVSP